MSYNVRNTTGRVNPTTLRDIPTTLRDIPTTRRELPTTRGELPTTRGELPTTRGEFPTTLRELPTTLRELPTTLRELPTTLRELTITLRELPTTPKLQNSFKNKLLPCFSALVLSLVFGNDVFSQTTVNFNYTGVAQTWTVPSCVNTITVTAEGGQGGGVNLPGGLGATVTATVAVTPGQVLQINVGGMGTLPTAGWNGGGSGFNGTGGSTASGGGGGASDIRLTPYALANRVVVSAGGGGTGGGDGNPGGNAAGGAGGCMNGVDGAGSVWTGTGGLGATQTAGGSGGPPWGGGQWGFNGSLGQGGNGGYYSTASGGGGGGGYYGGGGGGSDNCCQWANGGAAGGGGSSLIPAGGTCTQGNNTGNGQVTITYVPGGLSTISSTNPLCNGGTGSASVTMVGGTSPYIYLWSPSGGNSSAATGLSAGNYTVTVTDALGCTSTNTLTITIPAALTVSVVSTTTVVCGANNGTATVAAAGGTGSYTYLWSPTGGATAAATGLSMGNYVVTVTDANGCTTTQAVTITGSGSYTVNTTQSNILCFGNNNGSATVNTSGGSTPFTYAWSTNPAQTTPTISNIPPGNYTCTITDATGCVQTATFTVTQPPALTGSITNPVNVSCFGGSNGSATANGTGGTGTITYSWNTAPAQTSATANNLPIGSYVVTITDANGCSLTQSVTITQPTVLTTSTTSTPSACGVNNGTASVTSSGGTAPHTYQWLTTPVQSTPTIIGLAGGNYTIIVIDANGCNQTQNVAVSDVGIPVADFYFTPDVVSTLDPLVLFTDGSTGNATSWSWDFGDTASGANNLSSAQNATHSYSVPGTYCITLIISDPFGVCADTIVKCLRAETPFTFYMPNAFTPNSDYLNELFYAKGQGVKDYNIWIFDRWGNMIWDCHYSGNSAAWDGEGQDGIPAACKWDGKITQGGIDMSGGSKQLTSEDVYMWKVILTDIYGMDHKYIGHFTIVK